MDEDQLAFLFDPLVSAAFMLLSYWSPASSLVDSSKQLTCQTEEVQSNTIHSIISEPVEPIPSVLTVTTRQLQQQQQQQQQQEEDQDQDQDWLYQPPQTAASCRQRKWTK